MNTHNLVSRPVLTALLAAGLLTSMGAVASAQDCTADADCAEGFHCELYGATDCVVAPGQDEPDCGDPVEFGACVRSPIACDTDADCPTYLSCITGGGAGEAPPDTGAPDQAPCMVDETGNCAGDGLIDPGTEQSYCAYQELTCDTDADCPSDFECAVYASGGGGCAAPACDPADASCDPGFVDCGDVEVIEYKACQPREITCAADADCPTEWQCVTESWGTCSGGGSTDGDAGAPAPDQDPIAPDEQCQEETISRCLPTSLVDYYGSGGGDARSSGDDNGSDGGDGGEIFSGNGNSDGGDSSASSCSTMNLSPTAGGFPIAALLVLGLALLPLRRR